jgi:hypothetical protein
MYVHNLISLYLALLPSSNIKDISRHGDTLMPVSNKKRARRVIRRGTRRTVGKFPSLKGGKKSIHWESTLERDLCYLLEIDPDVITFKEQPLKIMYVLDGKVRYYTPDLLVIRKNKKQLVEVKPKNKLQKYIHIFHVISQICEQNGYEFVVLTEKVIRQQPRLNNIKLLWKYSRTVINPQHQIACREFFLKRHVSSLKEVREFFESIGARVQVAYGLLYWGLLEIDLINQPINLSTSVRLPVQRS